MPSQVAHTSILLSEIVIYFIVSAHSIFLSFADSIGSSRRDGIFSQKFRIIDNQ